MNKSFTISVAIAAFLFFSALVLWGDKKAEVSSVVVGDDTTPHLNPKSASAPLEQDSTTVTLNTGDSERLVSDTPEQNALVIIGEYIDPDRGQDLSNSSEPIEIGDYIDPDRGADYTTPAEVIEIGEYIDPDRGSVFEVDPLEQLSIGAFIDPDGIFSGTSEDAVEIGEVLDPDRP